MKHHTILMKLPEGISLDASFMDAADTVNKIYYEFKQAIMATCEIPEQDISELKSAWAFLVRLDDTDLEMISKLKHFQSVVGTVN